jgi:hypothetical protein
MSTQNEATGTLRQQMPGFKYCQIGSWTFLHPHLDRIIIPSRADEAEVLMGLPEPKDVYTQSQAKLIFTHKDKFDYLPGFRNAIIYMANGETFLLYYRDINFNLTENTDNKLSFHEWMCRNIYLSVTGYWKDADWGIWTDENGKCHAVNKKDYGMKSFDFRPTKARVSLVSLRG